MNTSKFDIASHLKTDDDFRVFLQEVLETGTSSDFVHALGIVAKAQGMSKVSDDIGVSRSSLYKSLSEDGNPNFSTIFNTLKSCGLKLTVV